MFDFDNWEVCVAWAMITLLIIVVIIAIVIVSVYNVEAPMMISVPIPSSTPVLIPIYH